MKTTLLSYLRRYRRLHLAFLFLAALSQNDVVFKSLGMFAYGPALVTLAALCGLLLRNLFHGETTDRHVDSGEYTEAWNALNPIRRMELTFWQSIAYFLSASIIIAAIAN